MPTSPQQFFLGMLSLLAVSATDAQAQMRPAAHKAPLVTHASKHEAHAIHHDSEVLRGINTTITLPRQSVEYSWNSGPSRWDYPYKGEYVYDANGRISQYTSRDSASNTPSYRNIYVRNAQGRETSSTSQYWNNNAWENSYRYLTTYDARGNQTESLDQEWKNGSWVTTYGSQTAYTYNAAGVMTESIRKRLVNGVFELDGRVVYTLTNGQWSSILYQVWDNNAWQNEERILDIVWYDWAQQLPASYREQEFDGTSFVDEERGNVTYSSNGSSVGIYQRYNGTAWVNDSRYSELNDAFGNNLSFTEEEWINNAWSLEYGDRNILFYNASNVVLRKVNQRFDNDTRQWYNDSRSNYSNFQTITLAARNAALEARATLYPNPAAGLITLDVADVKGTEAATGEVRNALGQLVQQFTARPAQGQIRTQLDLSNLKAGIYTVRLQTGDGALVKRVVRN